MATASRDTAAAAIAHRLLPLIDEVYATVPDLDRWPRALEAVRRASGAAAASLQVRGTGPVPGGGVLRFTSSGYDAARQEAYRRRLHRLDPYWPAPTSAPPPRVMVPGDLADPARLRGTRFHDEYLAPEGLAAPLVLYALRREDGLAACLTLERRAGSPPWSEAQVDLARALLPHVERALDLTLRHRAEADDLATVLRALDGLPAGLALLDGGGRVVWASRAARAAMTRKGGLRRGPDGRLRASAAEGAGPLTRLLDEALLQGRGGTIALRRGEGAAPLLVTAMPAAPAGAPPVGAALALLVTDPARPRALTGALRAAFRLTPTEAKIAIGLAQGRAPKEIAQALGGKVGTVRAHMKAIFAKLEVTRQPELVKIVAELSTHEE